MANAIRSTPAIHWKCEQNIVRKFMCTLSLDDILDKGSKFQYNMFISFPQFIYCSHDEVYFPKLSCLIAADGGTLYSKWAPYNGCYASHSWRHKATCDVSVVNCESDASGSMHF